MANDEFLFKIYSQCIFELTRHQQIPVNIISLYISLPKEPNGHIRIEKEDYKSLEQD
jgi:hypothetical protein